MIPLIYSVCSVGKCTECFGYKLNKDVAFFVFSIAVPYFDVKDSRICKSLVMVQSLLLYRLILWIFHCTKISCSLTRGSL